MERKWWCIYVMLAVGKFWIPRLPLIASVLSVVCGITVCIVGGQQRRMRMPEEESLTWCLLGRGIAYNRDGLITRDSPALEVLSTFWAP